MLPADSETFLSQTADCIEVYWWDVQRSPRVARLAAGLKRTMIGIHRLDRPHDDLVGGGVSGK